MASKQETQLNPEIEYFTADVFHKESDADSIFLVEGISESRVHKLNGKVVKPKEISFGQLIQTEVSGINGFHRFNDAFSRRMHSDRFEAKPVEETLKEVSKKYGAKVGDCILLQEWKFYAPESSVQGRDSTPYLITEDGFRPFKFGTGEWLN